MLELPKPAATLTSRTCTRRRSSSLPQMRITAWTRAKTSWGTKPSHKPSSTTSSRSSAKTNLKTKLVSSKTMPLLNREKFTKRKPPVKSSRRRRKRYTTQRRSLPIRKLAICFHAPIRSMGVRLRFRTSKRFCKVQLCNELAAMVLPHRRQRRTKVQSRDARAKSPSNSNFQRMQPKDG